MKRRLYTDEHEAFRDLVRSYLTKEVEPVFADWENAGIVPRELYNRLGELGIIGVNMPESHGGGGQEDYRFNAVLQEECARACVTLGSVRTHLDVVLPYFRAYANDEQRDRWFPGLANGEYFSAIALTEPDTGSDLAGVSTSAVRDGDHYVVNGAKTFISGAAHADLVITLVRTSTEKGNRRGGLTLLVLENGMVGFIRGRRLKKIGLRAQDTVELSFADVRVPVANRLGDEGAAFGYLGSNLPQERLTIAVGAIAQSRTALDLTVDYARQRRVFGVQLGSFQNTKFELAAMAAELEGAQIMVDRAVEDHVAGELSPVDAAKVKLVCTELQGRVMDRCLQIFGGYGYVLESPIARLYSDARVTRIYGGTSEVMKLIISKSLGL